MANKSNGVSEEYVTVGTEELLKKVGYPFERQKAVTQAQAMRWLREEKKLSVEIGITTQGDWMCNVWSFDAELVIRTSKTIFRSSYESAALSGINSACKYLCTIKWTFGAFGRLLAFLLLYNSLKITIFALVILL